MQRAAGPIVTIDEGVALLLAGEVVAFPTETVYGLGANALSDEAVSRVFEIKGRPAGNPLIVHVSSEGMARALCDVWTPQAQAVVERFWPGPVTIVLPKSGMVPERVTAGGATVAIRCPDHPVGRALIERFGGPVVAPSANPSGTTSPTAPAHVVSSFGGRVAVIDGGLCERGIESTVLDLTGPEPVVLRPGAVDRVELSWVLGSEPVLVSGGGVGGAGAARSPGVVGRHYAPKARVVVFEGSEWPDVVSRVHALHPGSMALITHRTDRFVPPPHVTYFLQNDAGAYARDLYAGFRSADAHGASALLIERPPEGVAWEGVWDRIRRAASGDEPG